MTFGQRDVYPRKQRRKPSTDRASNPLETTIPTLGFGFGFNFQFGVLGLPSDSQERPSAWFWCFWLRWGLPSDTTPLRHTRQAPWMGKNCAYFWRRAPPCARPRHVGSCQPRTWQASGWKVCEGSFFCSAPLRLLVLLFLCPALCFLLFAQVFCYLARSPFTTALVFLSLGFFHPRNHFSLVACPLPVEEVHLLFGEVHCLDSWWVSAEMASDVAELNCEFVQPQRHLSATVLEKYLSSVSGFEIEGSIDRSEFLEDTFLFICTEPSCSFVV